MAVKEKDDDVKKKEKKHDLIKEKEEKIKELTDLVKRVQADFENYKKRVEKEQKDFIDLGKILMIKRLLAFLDSFDEASKDKSKSEIIEPLYKQLKSILGEFGFHDINVVGERFDPYKHECICEEYSEKPKGTILEEIQKGYMINDFIVRHAKVKVSKGKQEEKKGDDNIKKDSKA